MPKRKKKYLDFSSIQLRYLKCVMTSVGRTYLTSMCIKEFGEWLLRVHTNWSKLQDQQLWNFRQIKSTDVGNVEKKEEVLFMEKNVHIFIGAFYIKESIKCGFVNQLHFVESFIQFRSKCGNIKKKMHSLLKRMIYLFMWIKHDFILNSIDEKLKRAKYMKRDARAIPLSG